MKNRYDRYNRALLLKVYAQRRQRDFLRVLFEASSISCYIYYRDYNMQVYRARGNFEEDKRFAELLRQRESDALRYSRLNREERSRIPGGVDLDDVVQSIKERVDFINRGKRNKIIWVVSGARTHG